MSAVSLQHQSRAAGGVNILYTTVQLNPVRSGTALLSWRKTPGEPDTEPHQSALGHV